jgi:phage-related protein
MYKIVFYRDRKGDSEVEAFLDKLAEQAATNKDARIQLKQVSLCIQLLSDLGTRIGEKITKHIDEGIWELRPGKNRVLYFYFKDDTFVLLHSFRKKTQKTPKKEIDKAKRERADWIERQE